LIILIGVSGNTSNLLSIPYGFDFDSSTSTIYVADSNNNRIIAFTLGSLSGVTVADGNAAGLNNTQLWSPEKCYFDSPSNSLVISNIGTNNVVRWILGDNHWTLIAGDYNGTLGNTSTLFQNPRDLTLDPMGNLYVADKDNHRIQFFFAGQSNGITEISGNDSILLNSPKSVALDNQLNLYVSDSNNHRIQMFQRY
jgi:DNA-binding beta-propeller fold protein YncE